LVETNDLLVTPVDTALVLVFMVTIEVSASRFPKVVPVGAQLLLATVKYHPLSQLVPFVGKIDTGKPRRIASDLACSIDARKSLLADVSCWFTMKDR